MQRGFRELKAALLERLEDVVKYLYPGAVIERGSAYIGNNPDGSSRKGPGKHGSLVVSLGGSARGACKDYGSDWKGDVIGLWQLARSMTLVEVLGDAGRFVGFTELASPKPPPSPPKVVCSGMSALRDTPVMTYLANRGISESVMMDYRIRSHRRESPHNQHFMAFRFCPPEDTKKCVMLKSTGIKLRPDGRKDIWSTQPWYTLWGWWLVGPNDRSIIITEGEIDAMSVATMKPGMPVLSLPSGASNDNWIENDWQALQRFESIYLLFDSDEAGQKAAHGVSKRLGRHRCYLTLPGPYKDANEALTDGDESVEVQAWLEAAKTIDPPHLARASVFRDDAHKVLLRESDSRTARTFLFPELPFAYRDGECTIVTGYPGAGKSEMLYQSHLHEMAIGKRVCVASMEINAGEMLARLAQQLWQDDLGKQDEDRLDQAIDWLDGRLWFRAQYGKLKSWEPLLEDFHYAMQRYGCTRFVIDSLMYAVNKEDYTGQDRFCSAIKTFCNETGSHVALVSHAQAKAGEDKVPGMGDVLGSNGITAPFDNGLSLWRNIYLGEDEENVPKRWKGKTCDGVVRCWKQRSTGDFFRRDLYFHKPSRSFTLRENSSPPAIGDFTQPEEIDNELF